MTEAKRCECCSCGGPVTDDCSLYTVGGKKLPCCGPCWRRDESYKELEARIRSRLAAAEKAHRFIIGDRILYTLSGWEETVTATCESDGTIGCGPRGWVRAEYCKLVAAAEKAEVSEKPAARDINGMPFAVGDWVEHDDGDRGCILAIELLGDGPALLVAYKRDGKTHSSPSRNRRIEIPLHASLPSQPEASGVEGIPSEWQEHIGKRVRYVDSECLAGILIGAQRAHPSNGGQWCAAVQVEGYGRAAWNWAEVRLVDKTPGGHDGSSVAIGSEPSGGPPGLSFPSYPEHPAYAIAAEREPVEPPKVIPELEAFTKAVEKHLVPRLPKGLKVVTDMAHGGQAAVGSSARWIFMQPLCIAFVMAEDGRQLEVFRVFSTPTESDCRMWAEKVAVALMAAAAEGRGR